MNPKTGRCVKKNGKIGKRLLLLKTTTPDTTSRLKIRVSSSSQSCSFRTALKTMFPHMSQKVVQTFHVLFKKYIISVVRMLSVYIPVTYEKYPCIQHKDIVFLNRLCFQFRIPQMRHTHSALYPSILSCLSREIKTRLPHVVEIEQKAVETIDTILAASFKDTRNSQIEKFVDTFYYDAQNLPHNILFQKLFFNALVLQTTKK